MSTTRTRTRIAIVAPSLRILGGHAVQAERMLDGWKRDGDVDAWLVTIDPLPPAPFTGLVRIKYVRTFVTQLCYWPLLVSQLRRADVVHVFAASYSGFLLAAVPAILVAKAVGKPVVLNYHSGAAADHLARSPAARLLLGRVVDLNVVPSRFLRDVFATFGLESRVVSNSIDLTRFAYRSRIPLRPRLLSTRNLEPLYNVACTLRAFARIQARHPEATLTLIGTGSEDASMRRLSVELGLRNVTFLGRVAPSEMHVHYAAADIYVQTPSIDNMPLSLLEAFASGLPSVSTNVGGVPAILRDGVDGLLAPDNDDEAVANGVLELLSNPDNARKMAAAAHETCRAFEWPAIRNRWIDAYRAALNQRAAAHASAEPS